MNGVTAMVRLTQVSKNRVWSSVKMPILRAVRKATNANSPPWLNTMPTRCAVIHGRPQKRATDAAMAALDSKMANTVPKTDHPVLALKIKLKSISNPTVKKKSPTKIPRKGDAATSTVWRCFVSAMSMPDKKAPKVLLRPRPCVRKDIPKTMAKIKPIKASCDPLTLSVTISKKGTSRVLPNAPIMVSASVNCSTALPMACPKDEEPSPARIGVMTRSGTTIKSCNSKVPKDDLPYCVSICPLSLSNCRTKAELLSAKLHPIITAAAAVCFCTTPTNNPMASAVTVN
mmetsp:Transcript_22383/g.52707  ORF Transcript_22383/g.52707 Transcript_22383/m.52707 type:complete len:287 (-) Transcript_22383:777-1637(-)